MSHSGPDISPLGPRPRVILVHWNRATASILGSVIVLSSCAADVLVTAERSDSTRGPATTSAPFEPQVDTDSTPGTTTVPSQDTTAPGTDAPPETSTPDTTAPDPNTADPGSFVIDPDAIDFGDAKPERAYDDFLLATLTDLDTWWADAYPLVYGDPFLPLQGKVYAAYPERQNDLPGCGEPLTRYEDVQQFVAFYCGQGDFIVYDDGPSGLLFDLADRFGAGTIGIVLAHEYGHAVQQRSGVLARNLPTVASEQQADCFAGAWAGRAARGEGGIEFTDDDVRAGLIAMLEVRDPVGLDQLTPGGHGSGFDRVGAFQEGFTDGPVRCGELIDNPLPLMPNEFTGLEDFQNEGNAPFGYNEGQLLEFLPADLNTYWDVDAAVPNFDPITLVPVQTLDEAQCSDISSGLERGAAYCPSSNTVFLNEPVMLDLYRQSVFGDFSVGYLIGVAWAEAAQHALGSVLSGEQRELINDCLAGAWVKTVIPVDNELPEPRDPTREATVSPGDLDEAVRTVILIGDRGANDNVIGSPFEKIDAFRDGVLGGLDACAN